MCCVVLCCVVRLHCRPSVHPSVFSSRRAALWREDEGGRGEEMTFSLSLRVGWFSLGGAVRCAGKKHGWGCCVRYDTIRYGV